VISFFELFALVNVFLRGKDGKMLKGMLTKMVSITKAFIESQRIERKRGCGYRIALGMVTRRIDGLTE
jgi:molybdate-binding protein